MKIVTETAAKYSSPRFEEAELNARSQKASGSEHVSPGTSNETRTASYDTPPRFDSATRAGVSRFLTRAFLFLLVLAAGVSFLSPEASAQTPNRATFTWSAIGERIRFSPTVLRNAVGSYTINVSGINALDNVRVCTKTATPTTNAAAYWKTNCTYLAASNGNKTVSVTQAMVNNGGFVMVAHVNTPSSEAVRRAEWIALVSPAIVLSRSAALPVAEGSSATYTVKLSVAPTGSVKVRVASSNPDVKVKTGSGTAGSTLDLTFGTSDWNNAKTVTVSADSDADFVPDTARLRHTTVNADTSAEYDGAATVDLTVNVADNDPPSLTGLEVLGVTGTISQGRVSESRSALTPSPAFSGATTNYTVTVPETMEHIRIRPTAPGHPSVTITVDGTAYGSGYLTGRIKLAAVGTGKTINVVVANGSRTVRYRVTVTREAATITPSATTLNARAGTAVTAVTFTSGGAGFSPTSWSVDPALPQGLSMDSGTGRISGTPGRASAATNYTVTATGESSYTVLGVGRIHRASATVRIKVDPEVLGARATISATSLTVNEGSTASYQIALSAQPTGPVTVTASVSGSGDVSVSQMLTFTMQNYASAQSFTVTAGEDGDGVDDAAVISHAVSGGGYDGVAIEGVTVTVDDDEELGLSVTGTVVTGGSHGLVVTEGSTNTYSVALGSEPGSSVTVTPVVPPGTDVSVTPGSLEFDSANWETAKSFTVEAGEDDDTTDDTVRIRHSMSSAGDSSYNGKSGPVVTVTVDDNDGFGVTLGGTTPAADGSHGLSVNESATASYSIKLNAVPTGNVTIRLSAGRSSSISVGKNSLSFTVNNWNEAQTVKVTAAADGNAVDESIEITHTISGGGYGSVTVPKVKVTAVDDDKSSNNELLLMRLQSVTLSPAFSRTRTTYTASVPNSVSRVTVIALARDRRTATVSITPLDADANTSWHQVDLVTTAVNTITIRVTAQNGDVKDYTVAVTRAKSTTPASFSFTDVTGVEPGTEETSDAITVSVEDTTAAIPISVTSGGTLEVDGSAFSGNTVTNGQTVAVKVTASSDFATEVSATVTIGGVSDEFSVTTRAGRVNANLSALALADGKDGGGVGALALDQAVSDERTLYTARVPNSINKVKVTATAADTAATIEVNGAAVASGTESGAINVPLRDGNFSISIAVVAEDGTTEKRYKLQVKRRSTDAFLSGISVKAGGSELTLGRTSGGSAVAGFSRAATAYTVRVPQATTSVEVTPTTSDPLATVTVAGGAVSRTESGTLGATEVSLSSQSSTAVSIVVTPEDSTATSSVKTYTVTVEKTGMRVSVTPVAVTVGEGGTADYAVVLTAAPTAGTTVTVTPTSGDEAVATVTAALAFDSTNWNVPQSVTVAGLDDEVDNPGDSRKVTVTHAVSGTGSGYEGAVAATVSVAVTDDELTKVIYIGNAESLEDAGTLDFPVNLSPAGSSEVTVYWTHALRSGDAGQATPGTAEEGDYDAGAASGTLTFAVGETTKTISVPINDDEAEEGDERVTVILVNPSSASDLLGISGSPATGTIKDDDTIPSAPETPESPPLAETPESSPEDPGASDGDQSVFSVSGGGEVTEGDSGTTAQASFTVSLAAAGSREVSVGYATADGTAEAGSDYESASGTVTFSPGETSKTVSVTVNGDDEAEGNETFSLSLASGANGSVDPRNSSAQAVIANDDRKTVEAGMSGEFSVGETTVTVESTLPEDTELEVVLPAELESGGTAIEELAVTLGPTDAEIDAGLFGYTGSGADHVLVDIDVSPAPDDAVRICLPVTENLRRAAGRQRLYMIRFSGGEWEELTSETEGDAVCADVSGFSPFALVFEIDYGGRRAGDVNRAILPELSRAMTASTLEAVTSRIGDAMAGGGTTGAFGAPSSPEQEYGHAEPGLRLGELEDGETLSLTDAVDGSYYSVSLAGVKPSQGGESEAEPAPASRAGGLGMWVSGDYRSLSGGGGGTADWNGRLISGHLGADYRFGRSFLAGVATSWSQGSFDYAGRGEGASRVRGDYSSRMNSFHPYLGLSLSRRLALWAAGGWGFGEIRMDDGEIPARQKASTRLGTLATGADLALLGGGASALSLRGEAWISRVKVEGNGDRVEGLSVRTNRLRAALEGSHALSLGSGSSLVPSLEFAMRRDGGDGETGVGGELGGGISLVSSMGLAVEARGRGLLFHQGDAKEWGVGGSVRYDPGGDGRGLSMSVLPSWGNSASGVQGIWASEETADLGATASRREFGLQTEVGYGFAALDDRGLLTPYGAFGRPDPHSRNYRLGSRFSMNGAFDLTLEGRRRELRQGDPEHGLTLQGRLNW